MPGRALPTRDTTDPASHQPGRRDIITFREHHPDFYAMLHPSDEAFAFDERRQLGEVTSIVCSRACSAYLAEGLHRPARALAQRRPRPQRHGHVADGAMTQPPRGHFWRGPVWSLRSCGRRLGTWTSCVPRLLTQSTTCPTERRSPSPASARVPAHLSACSPRWTSAARGTSVLSATRFRPAPRLWLRPDASGT